MVIGPCLVIALVCGAHPYLNRAIALTIILAPSRSSSSSSLRHRAHLNLHLRAVALIFIFFAPSHLSSSSRRCTHLHCCAVRSISSLPHQVLRLHCNVKRSSFIVVIVPSCTLLLCLSSHHRGRVLKFIVASRSGALFQVAPSRSRALFIVALLRSRALFIVLAGNVAVLDVVRSWF